MSVFGGFAGVGFKCRILGGFEDRSCSSIGAEMATRDLRTRAGREAEVIEKIRTDGGFSVFWGCENQARANAIARLTNSGRIEQLAGGLFPWCKMVVK